ncbi:hypothetical protein N7510_002850 [Penicillium lagena]|uniref:uncharacterized protein n=1 Tax=Penicillium lagena TaxID=94218 RepID=UPI002540CC39|nr:uncharacterized protein N7510_002850 [Penicillium lagena]KAJ5618866.1 hypothetical protein N7510_002850 [Penicillium lagena]
MASGNYWRAVLVVVPAVGAGVATIFFILRFYSRAFLIKHLDIGDLLMTFGLLFCYGVTISTILAAFNGVGQDIWSLERKTRGRASLLFWLAQLFWALSQVCIKLSLIVLLRQLLGATKKWHIATMGIIIFTVAWGTAFVLVNIFQCWPPQHFWLRVSVKGTCLSGQEAFFVSMSAISLAEDVLLLLLPIIIVWRLKLATRQKILLTGLFSIGGFYMPPTLIVDAASGSKQALWTLLELDVAIVCTSLMLMRPFFKQCRQTFSDFQSWRLFPGARRVIETVKTVTHTDDSC